MGDCIFCKIVNGEIPTKKVYENEYVFAFHDIEPQAPIHVLIIPKKHIESVEYVEDDDYKYITEIFKAIKIIAKQLNINENGYRIVTNHKELAGQSVFHLHFHLLGGRQMK